MTALSDDMASELAQRLDRAEVDVSTVRPLTDDHPALSPDDAYRIQDRLQLHKKERGLRVLGWRVGTAPEEWTADGAAADMPLCGFLTDHGAAADGGELPMPSMHRPHAQAALAVMTRCALSPRCHLGEAADAIDWIMPGIEVTDTRYGAHPVTLPEVIADNACAARFALGGRQRRTDQIDFRTIGAVLEKNGAVVATGAGAAVFGHPLAAMAAAANLLAERGQPLAAGTLVLLGGVTPATPVDRGVAVRVRFQHLGTVGLRFV